ncbi:hypothetical protein [Bradyrhizobium nanningense]|uniref:hypothetical protein n=1 Tax=Bradyrhizobium nanningense TaxID=1325118 RepID=UPI001FE111E3|nr:hypothetical protein [Bradyrhizobium nanningense]
MLGASASGKMTTLTMLAGFEVPMHGSILLVGRSIDKMLPHKRDIGNYALFPHITVVENLALANPGCQDQAGARDRPPRRARRAVARADAARDQAYP